MGKRKFAISVQIKDYIIRNYVSANYKYHSLYVTYVRHTGVLLLYIQVCHLVKTSATSWFYVHDNIICDV